MTPGQPSRLAMTLICTLALGSQPCAGQAAGLPELGDSSAQTLSAQSERSLGAQTMAQLRAAGAVLDDPEVNAYLQALGQRLVASDRSIAAQDFEFFAVPDGGINAFALPGGYIGVNIGLIVAARSESELASVLAHEISHVSQHHIARQMEARSGSQLAAMAAMLAGIVAAMSGQGELANAAIAGATAGQAQNQLNYTRDHEREADRLGFELLRGAGFDPAAMAAFFTHMQQLTRAQESNAPGYLRSHPLTYERIAEAQDRALAAPYRQVLDSPDFELVRALLLSYQGESAQAQARLRDELARAPAERRPALRYGLAAALLRSQSFAPAMEQVEAVDGAGLRHPMVEALAGQILQQAGRLAEAIDRYRRALANYPDHRQLVQDYPRALLRAGEAAEAAEFARGRLARRRDDAQLQLVAAEAYARLDRQLLSHYHQGEAYAAMGNLAGAVEQFEIALRAGSADSIARQIAETRLGELRRALQAARAKGSAGAPRSPLQGSPLPLFTSR